MLIISNKKLHCCLVALLLFILIFLSLPLFLIYMANKDFQKCQRNPAPANQNLGANPTPSRTSSVAGSGSGGGGQQSSLLAGAYGGGVGLSGGDAGTTSFETSHEVEECVANHFEMGTTLTNCSQYAFQADLSLSDENFHCPIGTFPCASCPDICIEQWRNCNGHADCPDRSDESYCHDNNGIIGSMIQHIVSSQNISNESSLPAPSISSSLSSPSSSSSISSAFAKPESCTLEQFIAEQCPCVFTDPKVIICENLGLTKVPSTLLSSVYKIRMSNNSISNIDHVLWPRSLTSLVLVNNRIDHIGRTTFETAPNLLKLYLAHNEVSHIDSDAFAGLTRLTSLAIEDNKLTTFDSKMFKSTPWITKIYLSENMIDLPDVDETRFGDHCQNLKEFLLDHNRISKIRSHWFSNMTTLKWLSLMHNEISFIEDGSFDWNYELEELNLSFNRIKFINRQTFAHRLNLQRLYLGANPLSPLPVDAFKELLELKSLNLTHVQFDYIINGTFTYLTKLDFIYFAKFRYCHYANHVRVCRPSTDGLSSVRDLLAFPALKYAVWIVASVCSLGNVFVFIWRSVSPHEDCTLSLFIRNLSIADLMMGIYLGAIGWQDWKYQQEFGRHAIEWMSSWACTSIGFLAILSSELSVFILTIITIERYRSIISIEAREEEEAQKRRARYYVALAWTLSLLIACYPLVEWLLKTSDYYATNGLCLPLHIDQPYTPGWQYSAFIYLGINFSAVMVIIVLYFQMYCMIMKVQKASKPAVLLKAEKRDDAILAIRFFFIVITDCLCWIPIVVIKVMALANVSISSSIYGWLVVFIIPINSALNPIVYTLAAPTSLRAAVCRLFERICYKVDDMLATSSSSSSGGGGGGGGFGRGGGNNNAGGGGGSYSSQSPSSGSGSNLYHSRQMTTVKRRNKTGSNPTSCDTIDTSISSQHSIGGRITDCGAAEIAAITHATPTTDAYNRRPQPYSALLLPTAPTLTTTTMASQSQVNKSNGSIRVSLPQSPNGTSTAAAAAISIFDSPLANQLLEPINGESYPTSIEAESDGENFYQRHQVNSVAGPGDSPMANENGRSIKYLSTYDNDAIIKTNDRLIKDKTTKELPPLKSSVDGERLVAIVVPSAPANNSRQGNKGTLRHISPFRKILTYDPLERRTSIETTNMSTISTTNRNQPDDNLIEKSLAIAGEIGRCQSRKAAAIDGRRFTNPSLMAEGFEGLRSEHCGGEDTILVGISYQQQAWEGKKQSQTITESSYIFPNDNDEEGKELTSDSLIDLKSQQQVTTTPRQSRISFGSKDSRTCLLSQTDSC